MDGFATVRFLISGALIGRCAYNRGLTDSGMPAPALMSGRAAYPWKHSSLHISLLALSSDQFTAPFVRLLINRLAGGTCDGGRLG